LIEQASGREALITPKLGGTCLPDANFKLMTNLLQTAERIHRVLSRVKNLNNTQ